MDSDLVNRFSKFMLKGKEDEGVELATDDISQCQQDCERSLLCQIWGTKSTNFTGLKNTLGPLWCQTGELRVIELGSNSYQFVFSHQGDKEKVLARQPWFFDNQILVLHQWQQQLNVQDPIFRRVPMWIQVRGLPHHWSSKEVGWKLGKVFPSCLNVVLPENGSKEGKLLKLLDEVQLDMPLLRGTKLKLGTECRWVEFKYEQVPTFFFYCGIIGHLERGCLRKVEDAKLNKVCEGQYGEWMRAVVLRGGRKGVIAGSNDRKQPEIRLTPVLNENDHSGSEAEKTREVEPPLPKAQMVTVHDSPDKRIHSLLKEDNQMQSAENDSNLVQDVVMSDQDKQDMPGGDQVSQAESSNDKEWPSKISTSRGDGTKSRSLQELDQNILIQGHSGGKERNKLTVGKWKRIERQEGELREEGIKTNLDNHIASGSKRERQGSFSEPETQQAVWPGKKQKGQNKENEMFTMQVEVASLEWPHAHQ